MGRADPYINPFLYRPSVPSVTIRGRRAAEGIDDEGFNSGKAVQQTGGIQPAHTQNTPLSSISPELYASYYLPTPSSVAKSTVSTGPLNLYLDEKRGFPGRQINTPTSSPSSVSAENRGLSTHWQPTSQQADLHTSVGSSTVTLSNSNMQAQQSPQQPNPPPPSLADEKSEILVNAGKNTAKKASDAIGNLIDDIQNTPYVGTAVTNGLIQGAYDAAYPVSNTLQSFLQGNYTTGIFKILGWAAGLAAGHWIVKKVLITKSLRAAALAGVAGLGTAYAGAKTIKSLSHIRQGLRNHSAQEVQDGVTDTVKWGAWTAVGGGLTKRQIRIAIKG